MVQHGRVADDRDFPQSQVRPRSGRRPPPAYHPAMLLALDIGNTNVTVGLFRAGALLATRRAATNPRATTDEVEFLLDGLLRLDGIAIADLDAIALASVVPILTGAVEMIAERRDRPLLVASAGTVPLAVRVDRPDDVGADRLVNALAAARLHGTPAVVVDFGTATTLDCVASDGAYVGRAIGRDTVSAMQSGTIFGYQALAAGLLSRVRAELADANDVTPADVRAILTGGLSAAPWARSLEGIDAIDPDLTLKGLAILHAEVGGGEPLRLGLA